MMDLGCHRIADADSTINIYIYRFQTVSICFADDDDADDDDDFELYFTYFHFFSICLFPTSILFNCNPSFDRFLGSRLCDLNGPCQSWGEENAYFYLFAVPGIGTPKVALAFNLTPGVGLPIESDNQPSACEGRGITYIYIYIMNLSQPKLSSSTAASETFIHSGASGSRQCF